MRIPDFYYMDDFEVVHHASLAQVAILFTIFAPTNPQDAPAWLWLMYDTATH